MSLTTVSLKKRKQFVDIGESGHKIATKGLVLQAKYLPSPESYVTVGVTATRRLGGAVVRNRVKRRLRALARETLPAHANPAYQFVLIGRHSTLERPYTQLKKDMVYALHAAGAYKVQVDSVSS